ncbi:putative lipoprotein [Klebsiella oxytoca KA-2]|nr:putative lipoprotein [Klebsiella oxytoca KA-2]
MKSFNEKILNLLILFIACILGGIVSFLCITLSIDVLV